MKKHYILSTLLVLTIQSFAQWPARYNSGSHRSDQARLIAVDENNNVYVTGASDGAKGGNWDIVTIKYNSSGAQQWIARYNGPGNGVDYPYAMTIKNGFVYVTGRSPGAGTNDDCVTLKYDINVTGNGKLEWAARTNGSGFEQGRDVKVDNDGNVFVSGYSGGSSSSSGTVMTTIKYGAGGNFVCDHNIPFPGNDYGGNSIVLDGLGNIYVAGAIYSGSTVIKYKILAESFSIEWQTNFSNNAARKMLADPGGNLIISGWGNNFETIKVDPSGNIIGQYSCPNAGAAWDMKLDNAGNIYLTGIKMGQPDGSNDYATAKINADGSNPWLRFYSTSPGGRDHARSIALDAEGNVFVTGFSELKSGRNINTNYATVKYDNNGGQQWAQLYDGPDKTGDEGFAVATDANRNAYVTGQSGTKTNSFDYVTVRYTPDLPASITKSEIQRETIPTLLLSNYPNPFIHTTTIEYQIPKQGKVKLSIYDLQGKEVAILVNETKAAGVYKINFAAHKLAGATYICRLQSGELIQVKKLVITR